MLLFKDLKQNYPVFVLDRQNMTYQQGTVKEVSFPHMEANKPMSFNNNQPMVVDLTVTLGDKVATYVIPDSLSLAYVGSNSTVISTDKEAICREIEAQRATSEEAIKQVEHHKEIVERAKQLLIDLSPAYKSSAEYEKKIEKIEGEMSEMRVLLTRLCNGMKN